MDEILSQKEINDLLRGAKLADDQTKESSGFEKEAGEMAGKGRSDDPTGPVTPAVTEREGGLGAAGPKPQTIKMYDFKRPDKFSREQIRIMQMIHETFARLATAHLSSALRTYVNVHVASVDQLTYEEFSRSIPNPTTLVILGMAPLRGSAVLEIDPTISFAMVDRLFGGEGVPPKDNRETTRLEQQVLDGPVGPLLGRLREAWSCATDLRPVLQAMETNIRFAQVVPPNDMVVLITLETRIGEVEGMMNLCIPYITLESILGRLTLHGLYGAVLSPKPTVAVADLGSLPFPAEVSLPLGPIPYGVLSRLKAQQVLPLGEPGKISLAISIQGSAPRSVPFLSEGNLRLGPLPPPATTKVSKPVPKPSHPPAEGAVVQTNGTEQEPAGVEEKARVTEALARVKAADPVHLAGLVLGENPQAIALCLSLLDAAGGARFLMELPVELQAEVSQRVSKMQQVDGKTLRTLGRVLGQRLGESPVPGTPVGGIGHMVEVLNRVSRSTEKTVIESLEGSDPELAEEIKKRMFVFEDIVLLDDKSLQMVLRETDHGDLVRALRSVPEGVKEKVYRNMSDRAVKSLKEDMGVGGPMRLAEVEECQMRIVNIIRRMEGEGLIHIARPGDEGSTV